MMVNDEHVKMIADARAELESGRIVVFGASWWSAPTDESWVVVCSGGVRHWWDPRLPALYSDPDRAVSEWLLAAKSYSEGRNGVLYWNEPPALYDNTVLGLENRYWSVVSKLLISDRLSLVGDRAAGVKIAEDSANPIDVLMAIPRI